VSVKAGIHHKDTKDIKKGKGVEYGGHRGHREEVEIQDRNAGVEDRKAGVAVGFEPVTTPAFLFVFFVSLW
jgi:hypothetical protein